jgi:hypothetical protein
MSKESVFNSISVIRYEEKAYDYLHVIERISDSVSVIRHEKKASIFSWKERMSDCVSVIRYEEKASDYLQLEGKDV